MDIIMPKLGLTMTEGTLARWLKAEGEPVKQGEILFEFESDKSLMEFECPTDGVLTHILIPEGQTVPCGTPVAILETVSISQSPNLSPSSPPLPRSPVLTLPIFATPAAKRRARELGFDLSTVAGRGPQGRIQVADVEAATETTLAETPAREAITPVAKKVATDFKVDWTQITGSGAGGRVVKEDILQATSSPSDVTAAVPHAQPETQANIQPLSGVRGVIARRMSESAFSAPHVTLFTEGDASALVEARTQLNAELAGQAGQASDTPPPPKISYNALLTAIAARALRDHPHLNACLVDNEIRYYDNINIALAVDTERGLLVPVIRRADQLDLVEIQRRGDHLIQAALEGRSLPDDLSGGTFTITNLGMFDVDGFTPIINQPQAAILGVGRIVAKPVAAAGDEIIVRRMITLSLSFDHRIVDGGPAARFLQRIKQLIERPFALALRYG